MSMLHTRIKEASAGIAAVAWLLSGLYLCLTMSVSVFTWGAFGFILIGMILALLIVGFVFYVLHGAIAQALAAGRETRENGMVTFIAILLFFAEAGLTFVLARWAFQRLIA
jgi:hypothetical protein